MKISNELKIGFLVIITLIFFALGYAFIKNKNLFSANKTYYILCNDVRGINISDPITVRGIKIGVVKEFTLQHDGVKVTIETNGKVKIPANSMVNMDGGNLFGKRQLAIIMGDSQEAPDGAILNTKEDKVLFSDIEPIKNRLISTVNKLNQVLDSVNEIFDNNNKNNLHKTIANLTSTTNNLQKFSKSLNNQSENISEVISHAKKFTQSLNESYPKLDRTISNFENISYQISKVDISTSLTNTKKTLDKINTAFASHNSIMGALFNNDKLYNNIIQTTADLDRLLVDIRNNPEAFFHFSLFGKKANWKQTNYKVQDFDTKQQ